MALQTLLWHLKLSVRVYPEQQLSPQTCNIVFYHHCTNFHVFFHSSLYIVVFVDGKSIGIICVPQIIALDITNNDNDIL